VADGPRRLLIGEGAGIGPTLFLAEQMRDQPTSPAAALKPLVLLGSDTAFPFRPRPSVIIVPGIPTGVIACMPLLEEWGIASRLASTADLPGCFEGTVTALADAWLSALDPANLAEVEICACGAAPTLESIADLARRYSVPCQTSSPDAATPISA
jgi:dihydroorotate dehydrogenase electron transfer subunit